MTRARSPRAWLPRLRRALFWSRPLNAAEWALLARYFGQPQHPGWARMRLHLRRLGDTRRALSFNGGFVSMPASCFTGSDPRQCLRLDEPLMAGWLAHEAFHHWQRLQGRAVTWQALRLQWRFWRHGINPYAYTPGESPAALLAQFQHAQVEQQAQMWQDAVMADIAWRQAAPGADQQRLAAAARRWHAVLHWVQMQAVPPPPPLVP
ncbi:MULTISPECIES: hypothetical protein [Comamonas]|uniref:Uncharacterized protein n=1 Tax=Comamonas sediminis TaxID=1783360 RepID=A0ABV4B048_9BURK|nr:hypothetical protein [Comamonas sp. B21-038]ULR90999.1 hypothetical protein MJ205_09195 [Comamonas sp. B21-038]